VSSDCGFGRQGCNREIAFYKASAIRKAAILFGESLGWRSPMCRPPIRRCKLTLFRKAWHTGGARAAQD